MNKPFSSPISAVVISMALLLLPRLAVANHGLDGLDEGLVFMITVGMFLAILTLVNIVLACRNISRKSRNMRITNIVLGLPLLALSFVLLKEIPAFSMVGFAMTIVMTLLVLDSFEEKIRIK